MELTPLVQHIVLSTGAFAQGDERLYIEAGPYVIDETSIAGGSIPTARSFGDRIEVGVRTAAVWLRVDNSGPNAVITLGCTVWDPWIERINSGANLVQRLQVVVEGVAWHNFDIGPDGPMQDLTFEASGLIPAGTYSWTVSVEPRAADGHIAGVIDIRENDLQVA